MRLGPETRIRKALHSAILRTGRIETLDLSEVQLEKPRDWAHGDLACNAALVFASRAGVPSRRLAEEIAAALDVPAELVSSVEVAGPGFINLRLSAELLRREVGAIVSEGPQYGSGEGAEGGRIQLEFVSANPTGPLNVVSARAAAVGDSLSRILKWTGWEVETEFYVNDGGTQIDLFAASVRARFLEIGGFEWALPEDGYAGEWVRDIARVLWRLLDEILRVSAADVLEEPWVRRLDLELPEDEWRGLPQQGRASLLAGRMAGSATTRSGARRLVEEWLFRSWQELQEGMAADRGVSDEARSLAEGWGAGFPFGAVGVALMVAWQRTSLERFGVCYDAEPGGGTEVRGWFHESGLYGTGAVEDTLAELGRIPGAVYEKDGAKWLATSREGDDEDRVLVRSDGRPTYFLTDIAYHRDKRRRGYDRVIDIWGPDHHGHIGRMKAAMRMLGAPKDWLEVIIAQQVNVLRDRVPVKMSKRGGALISLDDLVEEAGRDTSRFFFLMRKTSSHLDFDLDLARKASEENPVYYVQYAFARISSIYEFARQRGLRAGERPDFSLLGTPEELRVMRDLVRFPGEVRASARTLEPHRLTVYLQDLAQGFHRFYTEHRVVGDDVELSRARLGLVNAVRAILETGMNLAGVEPPEARM